MKCHAKRLLPGQELFAEIRAFAEERQIRAGVILSMVGSLSRTSIRLADRDEGVALTRPSEIVSATGTVSTNGCHIHIAVADSTGKTIGGHLLDGCTVFTTIELVIGDLSETMVFERRKCEHSGFLELVVDAADTRDA